MEHLHESPPLWQILPMICAWGLNGDAIETVYCAGGRTLYAGTESGCIRCYRLPLTGEFQEYRCFSTAVLRLCMGSEGALLFATSADGAIATFDAKERDPMRMPRRSFPRSHSVWHRLPGHAASSVLHQSKAWQMQCIQTADRLSVVWLASVASCCVKS